MAKHSGVKDSGEYFVINPATRKVTVPHTHKAIGAVGDHNSEQVTFVCPQIVDGHDVSQCANRYITWFNVNGEIGHDELHITQVEQGEEGMVYLSWTIRNSLTVAKGVVQFSVHFEDTDKNGATLYRWSTATCKDCDILESINGVLGAYEAIYVVDETLVIEDYTLVNDNTLQLDTNGIIPKGTKEITKNGTYDIGEYYQVDVSVNPPTETLDIVSNGKYNVTDFAEANVKIPLPSGVLEIRSNGYHNVSQFAMVNVMVVDEEDDFVGPDTGYNVDGVVVKLVNNTNSDAYVYCTEVTNGVPKCIGEAFFAKQSFEINVSQNTILVCDFPDEFVGSHFAGEQGNSNFLFRKENAFIFTIGAEETTINFYENLG